MYKRQVFAESEVITLVGEGKARDEIAAGIELAVAKRLSLIHIYSWSIS